MNSKIKVSIIVPVRNEELYIEKCISSIINQDYLIENLEVIFIDGMSKDNTKNIIIKYINIFPNNIKLYDNPKRTVPYGMNIGIMNSTGEYIIRMDAHSEYHLDYVTKCILTLESTQADNVGGLALARGKGLIGECFAIVLSSKFGVGNSSFRTNSNSGYVDTVPFGTFRKETFIKYGLYDERLERNQDYELNYRIRKNGGRIYLNSEIKLYYYCRNNLSKIIEQSYNNGKWNVITMKLCPNSMSIRHFVPLIFLISLITLPLLSIIFSPFLIVLSTELFIYNMISIVMSLKNSKNLKQFLMLLLLFPIFHITYGAGSLIGIFKNSKKINRKE